MKNRKDGFVFNEIPNPFVGMSEREKIQQIRRIGQAAKEDFDKQFDELRKEIRRYDPLLLLSYFSYNCLTWDGLTRESERAIPISQHHVELLQTLSLQRLYSDYESRPVVRGDFQKLADLLNEISTNFAWRRLIDLDSGMELPDRLKFSKQDYMRVHTQFVRNPGYPDQIKHQAISLFASIDERLQAKAGLSIQSLIQMCYALILLVENRINAQKKSLGEVLKAKSVENMIRRYLEIYPSSSSENDQLLGFARQEKLGPDHMRTIFREHSGLFLPTLYTFTLDDALGCYPGIIEKSVLATVLDKWSLSFGQLSEYNAESFFLDNPIWHRPFIKIDEGGYFVPISGLLISYCVELMEQVLLDHKTLWPVYIKGRGGYLEQRIADLFATKFRETNILQSLKWKEGDVEYENDCVTLVDTTLIAVEAKSGRISEPAKRGAPERLREHVKMLVEEPAKQAIRLIEKLKSQNRVHRFTTNSGKAFELDSSQIAEYLPIAVTLDFWGSLTTHTPSLREAHLISENVDTVITMSLVDLEIVFEILGSMSEVIHYLKWRGYIENIADYEGDELDLLSVYIQDGFLEVERLTSEQQSFQFMGESEIFNPYFFRHEHGIAVDRPTRNLCNWWKSIIEILETDRPKHWLTMCEFMLELPSSIQFDVEKRLLKSFKKTRGRLKNDLGVQSVVQKSASKRRIFMLIVSPYVNYDYDEATTELTQFARSILGRYLSGIAIVIGLDTRRPLDQPTHIFLVS